MKIYIRNMACESCIVVVREALQKLKLNPVKVQLGEAEIKKAMSPEQKQKLNNIIKKVGLELAENKGGILISKIKAAVMEFIQMEKSIKINFSDYLGKKLKHDYTYMSNVFSEIEACTITSYINMVKMERSKEMILFEDLSLSEIAEKLNYSNLSHFSAQFKKTTGFPPSHFKKLKEKRRLAIQGLTGSK